MNFTGTVQVVINATAVPTDEEEIPLFAFNPNCSTINVVSVTVEYYSKRSCEVVSADQKQQGGQFSMLISVDDSACDKKVGALTYILI
jgi:hypothetical protein